MGRKFRLFIVGICMFPATMLSQVPVYNPGVVAVIGDYGVGGETADSLEALVRSWFPSAIITVGDNNYPDGDYDDIDENIGKHFHDYIFPYSGIYGAGASVNRFFPVLGNHDILTDQGQPLLNYLELPGNERYYDFVLGEAHFFALNSNVQEADGTDSASVQAQWLKELLLTSPAKWKIVFFHHPPYSSDTHYGNNERMQWPFAAWGADVVLGGHGHIYERILADGITYIINGIGGHSLYGLAEPRVAGSQFAYNEGFGALRMHIMNDSINFKLLRFDGSLIDDYTIYKGINNGLEELTEMDFTLAPNPSSGSVSVYSKDPLAGIRLISVSGQQLHFSFDGRQLRHDLPAGIYFLELQTATGQILRKRISIIN